jgi:hypothetical protein
MLAGRARKPSPKEDEVFDVAEDRGPVVSALDYVERDTFEEEARQARHAAHATRAAKLMPSAGWPNASKRLGK